MPAGDLKSLKEGNVRLLIATLAQHSNPLSITELHQLTGLSRPTIESNLQTIRAHGLLKTFSEPSKKQVGGRPARSFSLDYDSGLVAGIILGVEEVTVVLANLRGRVITSTSLAVSTQDNRPAIALNLLEQALLLTAQTREDLQCVTVGVIGETTALGRRLHVDKFPELTAETFFADFASKFPCPVIYRNDADLAALAEFHQLPQPPQVMVGINISGAFGAGIIINSQLFTGAQSGAGEMGHDHSLGWPGAFRTFTEKRAAAGLTLRGFYAQAEAGDAAARQVITEFISAGLPGVRALVCAFDPDLLVVSGQVTLLGDLAVEMIHEDLQAALPLVPEIRLSPLRGLSVETGSIDCCAQYLRDHSFGVYGS